MAIHAHLSEVISCPIYLRNGRTMEELIERFGRNLREQQIGLVAEWRKTHANTPRLLVWEHEIRDYEDDGSLSGDAWAHLQAWWRNLRSTQNDKID